MPNKRKDSSKKKACQVKSINLTAKEVEKFKQLLLEKRRELIGDVNEMQGETLKKSHLDATGDLSSMPIHMADLGTDNYEQAFALDLMDSEVKLLREIDSALQRIEKGAYGICEATGKTITKNRLKAQPWARYSVKYARMVEKGFSEPE